MKKLLLALLLAGFAAAAFAQVGVKAGVNFANMVFEEDEESIDDLTKNGLTGFSGGLTFILPLGGDLLALQPEILFTQKGAESSYTILGEKYTQKLKYNYIDVPILARVTLGDSYGEGLGIYLNAGPYFGYVLNGKSEGETPLGDFEEDLSFDDEDDQKRLDFGFVGGAGISIGNIFFEARYMLGTNNLLDDDADNDNDNFDKLQHRGFGLSLGLIF